MKYHPSIDALLRAEGMTDPDEAIRRRARTLVANAIGDGWIGPPFDVYDLAKRCDLKVTKSYTLLDHQDACVVPGHIILNARKSRARQKYSVGHEIVHTLFPDYSQMVALAKQLWRDNKHSDFERLCQIGAAEIVFPEKVFSVALERAAVSMSAVVSLAGEFDASPESTLRRAVELAQAPVLGLAFRPCELKAGHLGFMELDPEDSHRPHSVLGVTLVCSSSSCPRVAVTAGSPPPYGSAPDRAWKRTTSAKRITIWQARGDWPTIEPSIIWESEATTTPLKSGHPQQVLALLHPTH